ncbi:MAG: hypothetical protein DMG62_22835 [Acidobacteria bacterium]|nr:MAG: hypothetical protein DMG62_22835 [Acidobacteriota bacterium]
MWPNSESPVTRVRSKCWINLLNHAFRPLIPKFAQSLGVALRVIPTEFLKANQNKEQSTMKRSSLALRKPGNRRNVYD